jgi:L-lactate dehydrogenase complex protein LldG
MISVVTGPGRTADIEKTLVMGAHGPKEVYLFMADDVE